MQFAQQWRRGAIGSIAAAAFLMPFSAHAASEGLVHGTVYLEGNPQRQAVVELDCESGPKRTIQTKNAGSYHFNAVPIGHCRLSVRYPGMASESTRVHVKGGDEVERDFNLKPQGAETTTAVVVSRTREAMATGTTTHEVSRERIADLPGGETNTLPMVMSTLPGVVPGPFGQFFNRGVHGEIQYQIDGALLPDNVGATFGSSLSLKSIDHLEVITGGFPAEYGNRLSAIINITTKTGSEKPEGKAEIRYGSFGTVEPSLEYGGSTQEGFAAFDRNIRRGRASRLGRGCRDRSKAFRKSSKSAAVRSGAHGNGSSAWRRPRYKSH